MNALQPSEAITKRLKQFNLSSHQWRIADLPRPTSAVNVERSLKRIGFFATNAGVKFLNSNDIDPVRMYSEQILSQEGGYAMVNYLLDFLVSFLLLFLIYTMVTLVIFIIRIIVIKIRTWIWSGYAAPAVGIVDKLNDVTCNYNLHGKSFSYTHNFVLKIICGDQAYKSEYSEDVLSDHEPTTCPGQKFNVLWSEKDHKYLIIAVTKEEKRQQIKDAFHFATHITSLIFNKHYRRNNQKGNRYR